MAIDPGTSIGRYEVVSQIGQGGMGAVYRAFDPAANRDVALKVLSAGAPEEDRQRFRREVEVQGVAPSGPQFERTGQVPRHVHASPADQTRTQVRDELGRIERRLHAHERWCGDSLRRFESSAGNPAPR